MVVFVRRIYRAKGRWACALLFAASGLACEGGPLDPLPTQGATADATGTTTTGTTTTGTTTGATTGATTGEMTSSGEEGCMFIDCSDAGSSCAVGVEGIGAPRCSPCDVWAQDCPDGEKCTAWASNGSNVWDHTRCVSIGPDKPGDPCTVESWLASGADSCELDAMCWYIDENTLQGTCVSLCEGTSEDASCPEPGSDCVVTNDGVLNLCLQNCDPILQDCPPGNMCIMSGNAGVCVLQP